MNAIQTIQLDVGELLTFVNGVLTPLEAVLPQVAAVGGPIGLGVSAAAAILPLLSKIPIGEVYTVEVQQDIFARAQALTLLDFSAAQWKRSTPKPVESPAPAPSVASP